MFHATINFTFDNSCNVKNDHRYGVLEAIKSNNPTQLRYHLTMMLKLNNNTDDLFRLMYDKMNFIRPLLTRDTSQLLRVVLTFFKGDEEKTKYLADLKLDGIHNILQFAVIQQHYSTFTVILKLDIHNVTTSRTEEGCNILHLAAYYEVPYAVATVFQEGMVAASDVSELMSATNTDLEQPLHIASQSGRRDIVELFIKQNAPLECKRKDGATPILCAAQFKNLDVIEVLAKNGANVNAIDSKQKSILDYIGRNCPTGLLHLLFQSGLKLKPQNVNLFTANELEDLLNSCLRFDYSRKRIHFDSIFSYDFMHTGVKNLLILENSSYETLKNHCVSKLFINLQYAIMRKIINIHLNEDRLSVKSNARNLLFVNSNYHDNTVFFEVDICAYTGKCFIQNDNITVDNLVPLHILEEIKGLYEKHNGVPFCTKYVNIAPP